MDAIDRALMVEHLVRQRITVLGYVGMCGYPFYMLDPCTIQIWVPARHYLSAVTVCENIRCCGERVIIMVDDL